MKTFEEDKILTEEQKLEMQKAQEEQKAFEDKINNIVAMQESWNKPQEEVQIEPYIPTQEELDMMKKAERKAAIKTRLDQLSEDIVQYEAGEIVPNYPQRLEEFRTLHNELRVLEGKEPRQKQIEK